MPCNCRLSSCPECMAGYSPSDPDYYGAYKSARKELDALRQRVADLTALLQVLSGYTCDLPWDVQQRLAAALAENPRG